MGDFARGIEKDAPSTCAYLVTKGDVFAVEKEAFVQSSKCL